MNWRNWNMSTVKDAIKILDKIAPLDLSADWDNSGLQIGRVNCKISNVLFALDLTLEVVQQAVLANAEMIVTHHPVLFHKVGAVTDMDWQQELLLQCAEKKIAVFSVHTNWDAIKGGVNDILAKKLGLNKVKVLDKDTQIGRVGEIKTVDLTFFTEKVKKILGLPSVIVIDAGKKVHKVAICGGAGAEFIDIAVKLGCDTFLTSDIKYHEAQRGVFSGLNLIDGTHQATEQLSMDFLRQKFAKISHLDTVLANETRIMKVI